MCAWETDGKPSTGVLTHIKQLVDLEHLVQQSKVLPEKVTAMVMEQIQEYFYSKGIGGRELTELHT